MDKNELPLGFGFALAQNPDAMKSFANLSESEQSELLRKARAVSSKAELQALVSGLAAQG